MRTARNAIRPVAMVIVTLAMIGATLPFSAATAAPITVEVQNAGSSTWQPRPEDHPKTVTRTDLRIPMSDGTVLRADLMLPADAAGNAIDAKFPVVVTITAYNKSYQKYGLGLAGGDPAYLVKRGYAQLTVDARGTGSSGGNWCAFCTREDTDAGEVMTWAHRQAWSNGDTAMTGPSYMGITQIFAAAAKPAGLKAIFPQVPGADVYRDVLASGGALDVGFIPLWLGLVTGLGIIPGQSAVTDPAAALGALLGHVQTIGSFTAPLALSFLTSGDAAYDGPFYAQRSPVNVIDKVDVPTFLIGGEYDLFQRGTPLLYENLRERGVPTKMIVGPWDHLQGSSGAVVADAGEGTLSELQLRWFDHYVKGIADPTLDTDVAPVTYFEQISKTWRNASSYLSGNQSAQSWRLSGTSAIGGTSGTLTTGSVTDGTSTVPPVPVQGLCTRSFDQWTAGATNMAPFTEQNPCLTDNRWNDLAGLNYDSAPMASDVSIKGPINARLYVSSSSGNGMLSVAVEDVAPDGTVTRLSGGWQVLSFRALDEARSRYLDGKLIQPFHPFTKASQRPLAKDEVAPIDVEVFPTGAQIPKGHRLRLAVQAYDVPHALPTLADLGGVLAGVMTVHNSATYPSELTLPVLSGSSLR